MGLYNVLTEIYNIIIKKQNVLTNKITLTYLKSYPGNEFAYFGSIYHGLEQLKSRKIYDTFSY